MCVVYLIAQVLSTVLLLCHTLEVCVYTVRIGRVDAINVRVGDQTTSIDEVLPLVGSSEGLVPLVLVAEDPGDFKVIHHCSLPNNDVAVLVNFNFADRLIGVKRSIIDQDLFIGI